MSGTKQSPDNPIPQFATREEEAEFWDTHDFTDYWDQLQPISVTFGDDLGSPIGINLDAATRQRVCKAARDIGAEPDDLVRQWITAGLQGLAAD